MCRVHSPRAASGFFFLGGGGWFTGVSASWETVECLTCLFIDVFTQITQAASALFFSFPSDQILMSVHWLQMTFWVFTYLRTVYTVSELKTIIGLVSGHSKDLFSCYGTWIWDNIQIISCFYVKVHASFSNPLVRSPLQRMEEWKMLY